MDNIINIIDTKVILMISTLRDLLKSIYLNDDMVSEFKTGPIEN